MTAGPDGFDSSARVAKGEANQLRSTLHLQNDRFGRPIPRKQRQGIGLGIVDRPLLADREVNPLTAAGTALGKQDNRERQSHR